MCSGFVFVLVVHEFEKIGWYMYVTGANAWTLHNVGREDGAGDDIHVTGCAGSIFPGCHLDRFGPHAPDYVRASGAPYWQEKSSAPWPVRWVCHLLELYGRGHNRYGTDNFQGQWLRP